MNCVISITKLSSLYNNNMTPSIFTIDSFLPLGLMLCSGEASRRTLSLLAPLFPRLLTSPFPSPAGWHQSRRSRGRGPALHTRYTHGLAQILSGLSDVWHENILSRSAFVGLSEIPARSNHVQFQWEGHRSSTFEEVLLGGIHSSSRLACPSVAQTWSWETHVLGHSLHGNAVPWPFDISPFVKVIG